MSARPKVARPAPKQSAPTLFHTFIITPYEGKPVSNIHTTNIPLVIKIPPKNKKCTARHGTFIDKLSRPNWPNSAKNALFRVPSDKLGITEHLDIVDPELTARTAEDAENLIENE